jgi:hypothetical protein
VPRGTQALQKQTIFGSKNFALMKKKRREGNNSPELTVHLLVLRKNKRPNLTV